MRRPERRAISYQLLIEVARPVRRRIGRLGLVEFPPGHYVYTGSAKRGLEARLERHLRRTKALRWHIDYLLTARGVRVTGVRRSGRDECVLNRAVQGKIVCARFGASDCRAYCASHLKYLG